MPIPRLHFGEPWVCYWEVGLFASCRNDARAYARGMDRGTDKRIDRLEMAQQAFRDFYHACFWFMRSDAKITEADIPYIVKRLRADGGRAGFQRASELCH